MKKKLFALLSLAAGAAIVGTTFAAWAVTDNADPFSIKVTPSGSVDDQTVAVALSYGSTFHADNITGLSSEKSRVAAEVGLLATTSGATYEGKFSVALQDLTTGKPAGHAKLIDNLSVKVFSKEDVVISYDASTKEIAAASETAISGLTPDCVVPTTGENPSFSTSTNYTVTAGEEYVVYVVVALKSGLNPAQLDQINSDYVRITMDWGKKDGDLESSTVYFKALTGSYFAYAWDDNGKKNETWPGEAMTLEYAIDNEYSLYKYELGTQFTHVIFNNNNGTQTADLTVDSTIRSNTPCYDGSEWIAKPAASGLTADWYVVGTFNSWTPAAANAMTKVPAAGETGEYYKLEHVSLTAGAKLKVRNASGTQWRTSVDWWGSEAASIDGEGNLVVTNAGTYTIRMWSSGDNGNFLELVKEA